MRAKKTKIYITKEQIKRSVYTYNCPKCHVHFQLFSHDGKITRFLCECGQEIICNYEVKNGS